MASLGKHRCIIILIIIIHIFTPLPIDTAFYLSIGVGLIVLFSLDVFLGRVSKTNVVIYRLNRMNAGVFVVLMLWTISSIHLF